MNKYDKEFFRKLANQLMFDMTDEEIENVQAEFVVLEKQLELLETIDTEGVEEMIYPFETPTSFMREDEVDNVLSVEDALKNAKTARQDFIVLPRVVKQYGYAYDENESCGY